LSAHCQAGEDCGVTIALRPDDEGAAGAGWLTWRGGSTVLQAASSAAAPASSAWRSRLGDRRCSSLMPAFAWD